jgi:hypothetical protein
MNASLGDVLRRMAFWAVAIWIAITGWKLAEWWMSR